MTVDQVGMTFWTSLRLGGLGVRVGTGTPKRVFGKGNEPCVRGKGNGPCVRSREGGGGNGK